VEDRDLPLLDVGVLAAEGVHEAVLDGAVLRGGGAHGLLVDPGGRDDAAAAVAVGEQRQADAAVGLLDRRHHLVAHVGDAGVEVAEVAADAGGSGVHATSVRAAPRRHRHEGSLISPAGPSGNH
jgi:hypothetical protein